MTPSGSTYNGSAYSFTGANGEYPYAARSSDSKDNLYITTGAGGTKSIAGRPGMHLAPMQTKLIPYRFFDTVPSFANANAKRVTAALTRRDVKNPSFYRLFGDPPATG